MKDVLIIIPVYNEEQNLEYVINDLKEHIKDNMELVFINDGSTDASYKIIKKYNLKCLENKTNLGNYKTIQNGVKYAYEKGYKYVILFDADRQHKANEIEKVYNEIKENNADLVIGSRYYISNKTQQNIFKNYGRKICVKVIQKKFNQRITDVTSGFRCFNRKVMEKIIHCKMENFDLGFILELLQEKNKIIEIPVEMNKRIYGKSMYKGIKNKIRYIKNTYSETKKVLNRLEI